MFCEWSRPLAALEKAMLSNCGRRPVLLYIGVSESVWMRLNQEGDRLLSTPMQ